MTCEACEKAATEPWHVFHASCPGCIARGVARGPNFADSRKAGRQTGKYRDELRLAKVTHAEVLAAHAADFEATT